MATPLKQQRPPKQAAFGSSIRLSRLAWHPTPNIVSLQDTRRELTIAAFTRLAQNAYRADDKECLRMLVDGMALEIARRSPRQIKLIEVRLGLRQ